MKLRVIVDKMVLETISLLEKPEPEASENDVFGQYLFGDGRDVDEPNTSEENDFEKSLNLWVDREVKNGISKWGKKIKDLADTGKYEKYLKTPDGIKVYRGMACDVETAAKLCGVSVYDINDIEGAGAVWFDGAPDYVARWSVDSWTTELVVAQDFAERKSNDNVPVVLVLEATAANGDFSLNPEELTKIYHNWTYDDEKEVILFGKTKVDRVYVEYLL